VFSKLRELILRIFRYSGAEEYPRRYMVMNAFDGVTTVLGIIIGAHLLGGGGVNQIIGAGVGASLAMGISGASGTYMTEVAEQERKIRELENAMLTHIEDTAVGRAHKQAALIAAAVDSLAALLAGLFIISPYFLSLMGFLEESMAFLFSLSLSFLTLFILGIFLGKVAGRNIIFSGVKAVAVGVLTLILLILIDYFSSA